MTQICEQQMRLSLDKSCAGLETNHATEEWQMQVAKNQQNVSQIMHNLTAAKNRLAVLVGCLPQELDHIVAHSENIPTFDSQLVLSEPLTVMQNRPDVLAAQQAVYAAHYTKASELSRLWPTITLSTVMGRAAIGHSDFSKTSFFGLSLFQPLLDLVRIQSDIKVKQARVEQSIQGYMKTVLQAYEEVENTLSSYQNQQKQSIETTTIVRIQKRLYEQKIALLRQGLNSKMDVNTQQIQLLMAQQNQMTNKAAVIKAQLQVIKAAGY